MGLIRIRRFLLRPKWYAIQCMDSMCLTFYFLKPITLSKMTTNANRTIFCLTSKYRLQREASYAFFIIYIFKTWALFWSRLVRTVVAKFILIPSLSYILYCSTYYIRPCSVFRKQGLMRLYHRHLPFYSNFSINNNVPRSHSLGLTLPSVCPWLCALLR